MSFSNPINPHLRVKVARQHVFCVDEDAHPDPEPIRVVRIKNPFAPVLVSDFVRGDVPPPDERFTFFECLLAMDGDDSGGEGITAPAPASSGDDIQERIGIEVEPFLAEPDHVHGRIEAGRGGYCEERPSSDMPNQKTAESSAEPGMVRNQAQTIR